MPKNPQLKLDDGISSLQDLQAVITEIRDYARWFAHNAIKKRLKVKGAAPEPELSAPARMLIRWADAQKPLSQASLDDLLATLDNYQKTAPQLDITLAGPPPRDVRKKLVAWCRGNVAPNVLVNFQFDSAILGGLVVRSGSRVFDWSFRRQILANRDKFPEILRRV